MPEKTNVNGVNGVNIESPPLVIYSTPSQDPIYPILPPIPHSTASQHLLNYYANELRRLQSSNNLQIPSLPSISSLPENSVPDPLLSYIFGYDWPATSTRDMTNPPKNYPTFPKICPLVALQLAKEEAKRIAQLQAGEEKFKIPMQGMDV